MALKFKSVVTTAGQARIAAAMSGGTQVDIKMMVVGDGNGQPTTPVASQTKLVHEVYRQAINSVKVDKNKKSWLVVEAIIPASSGGFWMRELGLLAGDGTLLAVCNMADTYKPALEEGSGRTQTLRMVIAVSDSEAVTLTLDDSLIFATEEYVNQQMAAHEESRNHPDATLKEKGLVQLSSAINSSSETVAATSKAVKAAYDLANRNYIDEIYPVGIVLWFAQNKNPNTLFPGSTWKYIGENKTIRLASANGSDIMTTGGADTIKLAEENIPAHSHIFSATTNSFDYGTKTASTFDYGNKVTDIQGQHTHAWGSAMKKSGGSDQAVGNNSAANFGTTSAAGSHNHSVSIGEHSHTVNIGAHTHSVSGTTASSGSGSAVEITNAFVKLMGWYRAA